MILSCFNPSHAEIVVTIKDLNDTCAITINKVLVNYNLLPSWPPIDHLVNFLQDLYHKRLNLFLLLN